VARQRAKPHFILKQQTLVTATKQCRMYRKKQQAGAQQLKRQYSSSSSSNICILSAEVLLLQLTQQTRAQQRFTCPR
jgi:hypothetical protein